MDPVLASWIKEFVLRQNLPLNITNGILDVLPNEPADSESQSSMRVRRGVLQRRLAEGLTRRLITPNTLDTIESLYALRPLPAAVDAYRVVAVYLAASAADLPRSISDLSAHRIPNLLRSPSTAGLVSPSLDREVREMELSVTDVRLRMGIMTRNCKNKAVDAVRALLEAEYQDVGPPILEVVAENVHGDQDQDPDPAQAEEAELAGDDGRGDGADSGSRAEGTPAQVAGQQAAQTPPAAAQNQASHAPPAVAQNQPTQAPSGGIEMPRQSKIDGNRLGKGTTTPTTNDERGNSNRAMERDPTPRASRLGKGITLTTNEKEGNSSKAMEQDPTIHTYEQGDDLKAKAVCPPTLVVNKRRKPRKWSVLEEDTLKIAVDELGKGNWKEILLNHSDVFEGRTEVDLKDKWRNMTR